MSALERFSNAFPNLVERKVSYDSIVFYRGATIFFRRSEREREIARILSTTVENFPNGARLRSYLDENNVPISTVLSHPDYLIGREHWTGVIRIIREGM